MGIIADDVCSKEQVEYKLPKAPVHWCLHLTQKFENRLLFAECQLVAVARGSEILNSGRGSASTRSGFVDFHLIPQDAVKQEDIRQQRA